MTTFRISQFSLMALIAGALCVSAGCKSIAPSKISNDELAREFYDMQIQTIETLQQTFVRISQEYYTMSLEYKKLNQPELADLTLKKAEMFQQQHQQYEKQVAELQVRRARALRGEDPDGVQEQPSRPPAPAKAPPKRVIQTKPAPKTSAPPKYVTPAPAQAPAPALAPAPPQSQETAPPVQEPAAVQEPAPAPVAPAQEPAPAPPTP